MITECLCSLHTGLGHWEHQLMAFLSVKDVLNKNKILTAYLEK